MENNNGKKIEHRLTALETVQRITCDKVDRIIENHLPHLDKKINWIFTAVIVALLALIADLVVRLVIT